MKMCSMHVTSHTSRHGRLCSRQQLLHQWQHPAYASSNTRSRLSKPRTVTQISPQTSAVTSERPTCPIHRRAWHITQQGDMSSLRLVEEQVPEPLPGQVVVQVQAWGLNFADVFCALGLYKAAPKGDFVPGLEFAGTVVQAALGTADPATHQTQPPHTFKPGDRVLGVLRFGAFASHVVLPAAYLRPVPERWSFEQAASYPVQTLTAAYGLFEAGAYRPGQAVLVQSAAGGVGLQALQILSKTNAAALGLVGSSSKVQLLQEMYGQQQDDQEQQRPYFEFAVRQGDADAAKQQLSGFIQRAGCAGFDVILDSLGPGAYFQASYDALNPCGRHVIFGAGALTPKPGLRVSLNPLDLLTAPQSLWGLLKLGWGWLNRPRLDVLNMPGDNKGVLGFNLIWMYDRLDILSDLHDKVDAFELDPPLVGKVFGFAELPEALEYLQSGESVGKVVLSLDGKPEKQL